MSNIFNILMKFKILFLIILLTSILSAEGQILYTDFIPDTTLTAPLLDTSYVLDVDINHDGTSDFEFSIYTYFDGQGVASQEHIYPLDTNSKIGWVDTISHFLPCDHATIDSGIAIDNFSIFWKASAILEFSFPVGWVGCNQGLIKKFIPVKLYLNGNYHYGWIRILDRTPNNMALTIYDMSINLMPNQPITAAQITIGIIEVDETYEVSIYPIPFTNELKIRSSINEPLEVLLFDISSRKILQQEFTNSTTVNTQHLAKGIYLYEVRNKNGLINKGKVVKE